MNSSLRVIMELPLIILIGFLQLTALAAPVKESASSVVVAASYAKQEGMNSGYAQSFASSSSQTVGKAQVLASENPFLNGQFEAASSLSTGSTSNSGPSSLMEASAPAESLWSGNAGATSELQNLPSDVQNVNSNAAGDLNLNHDANSNSNANTNDSYLANGFAATNSNANVEDLGSSQVQGSGAVASAGQNQNQGSNENSETQNQNGRILHYAQSGPVIHIVTAGNTNNVEVSGNNQGTGSSNSAGSVSDLGQVESQAAQGLANSGSPLPGQNQQVINTGTSQLIVPNANGLPVTLIGLANAGSGNGIYSHGLSYILASNGIAGLYQNAIIQNSSSNSSSSSSHSESQQSSSSSNLSNASYNFGTVL